MIENKIYATESKGQLKKYRQYIEKQYPNYKHKIFIYLSLFEQEISENENRYYVKLTYQHIKKLLTQILDNESIAIVKNTNFVLTQYIQTLKSLMNENEKIEKIAKDLYKKYKSAFDLVYKYAHPNSSTYVPHNLIELIKNSPTIRPFKTSKTYIRFQPNFLYKNIEQLRKKGLINKTDTLEDNWLFLFEFHVTKTYIYFDMKIGEYSSQSSRKSLYTLFKNHPEIFNKVQRANDKLSPSWHIAFQKKILTTSEYNQYLEGEDTSIDDKINLRFKELIEIDLPKIESVILE